jgi:AcrR family transcriptional regulator
MPRTEEQNAALREKKKSKILEKCLRLFAVKGYEAVSVDDITAATNCSHGLFYHYFTGKQDIFNALMKLKEERYKDDLFPQQKALDAGGLAGLKIICDYIEMMTEKDDDFLYFAILSSTRHYFIKDYQKVLLGNDPFPTLVKLIKQGQEKGEIPAGEPCQYANAFSDLCVGAIQRRLFQGQENFELVHSETMMRIFQK